MTPLILATFRSHSYNPVFAIVTLTSSLNIASSPCASLFNARSNRLCSLTSDADLEDLRSSDCERSRRWVRKEDWERKK